MIGKLAMLGSWVAAVSTCAFAVSPSFAQERVPADQSSLASAVKGLTSDGTHVIKSRRRSVLFVTNRAIDAVAEERARRYGRVLRPEDTFTSSEAGHLSYGVVTVGYPAKRRRGEQDFVLGGDVSDPAPGFSVMESDATTDAANIRTMVTDSFGGSHGLGLVYIHGFNNSFADSVTKMAQLAVDLDVTGVPVAFSWPGDHGILRYGASEADATMTLPFFAAALDQMSALLPQRYDLLAHSMGSRIALGVLAHRSPTFASVGEPTPYVFAAPPRALVLAAPDVSRDTFDALVPAITANHVAVTVYCGRDLAMFGTRVVHGLEPLGASCTRTGSDLRADFVQYDAHIPGVNHSYFSDQIPVIDDIADVFAHPDAHEQGTIRHLN